MTEFISISGLRVDGRRGDETRCINCRMNVMNSNSKCDGSASLQQGNTKVTVAINGPYEITSKSKSLHDRAVVKCEVVHSPFSTTERRKRGVNDRRNMLLSKTIEDTFNSIIQTSLYKRCGIDITVTVQQIDGSLIPTVINCVMLALVDAGIPCLDFIVSSSVGYIENTCLLDLNHQEENDSASPCLYLAYMCHAKKIVTLHLESKLSTDVLEQMIDFAVIGCRQMANFLEAIVRESTAEQITSQAS